MATVFNIGSRARLIGRYALSAALVAIAGGLTLLISSSFLTAPMRFFFAAVVASAWWGGIGPAGFAIILSSLLVNYLFKPPLSFLFEFLAFSVIASWITYRGKRAEDALKRAHDQLEMRVEQRTAELTQTNELLLAEMAERRRAEDAYQQAQSALAHVTRVMTMGEMTASM
jgi:K+-sensing histidine kinase KdpD